MKTNSTKSKLMASLLVLVLCVTAFFGSTYAWFTDEVTSSGNKIQAGNLKVDLLVLEGSEWKSIKDEPKAIFDYTYWEPGYVQAKVLKVENIGNLALKWQAGLNGVLNIEEPVLSDVIDVYVKEFAEGETPAIPTSRDLTGWTNKGTLTYYIEHFAGTPEGQLEPGKAATFGIAFKMQESAGNEYQGLTLGGTFDILIKAAQLMSEKDSFNDEKYDEDATYDGSVTTTGNVNPDGSATFTANTAPSILTNKTEVEAPAGTFEPTDSVEVEVSTLNSLFNVKADGAVVGKIDVVLTVNDQVIHEALDAGAYTVTTYISKGLTDVTVEYTGADGLAQPTDIQYNDATGELSFKTTHFSEFAVSGKAVAYDTVRDVALATPDKVVEALEKNNTNITIVPDINPDIEKEIVEKVDSDLLNQAQIDGQKYLLLETAFEEAESDDTITLLKDVILKDSPIEIATGKSITLDLNGNDISGVNTKSGTTALINNKGNLTIKGEGTICVEAENPDTDWNPEGFPTYASNTIANRGTLTVNEGVTIVNKTAQGGASYAIDNYAGATLTVNGGNILQTGGDIAIRMNTASATANNVTINEGSTISGRRAIWIHLAGSNASVAPEVNLTIKGGKLTGTQMAIYSYSYGNSFANTKVTIDGGTFNGDLQFGGGYKADIETVIVNNGTFNGEVGRWVTADDFVLLEDLKDGLAHVKTADGLIEALESGKTVVLDAAIKIDPANMSNAYGTTGINVKSGQDIYGNGNTLDVKGAGGTWDSGVCARGGLIKDLTVTGSFRGIFIREGNEPLVLDNVTLKNVTYTISIDQANYQTVEAYNSKFYGWTSYAATIGSAKFEKCTFGEGNGYAFCRPYAPTEFVGCEFEAGYKVDPAATVTFENCTVGGVALTAENLDTLVISDVGKIENATVK